MWKTAHHHRHQTKNNYNIGPLVKIKMMPLLNGNGIFTCP